MKKLIYSILTLILGLVLSSGSCTHDAYDPNIHGVVINSVTWAKCNVDAPGTFATDQHKAGMFYQWNRKKGWPATGAAVTGWISTPATGTTWSSSNDPCPSGWRVPSKVELESLLAKFDRFTTFSGVNGAFFKDGAKEIFLPVVGQRDAANGSLYVDGIYTEYWSSTPDASNNGYTLVFNYGIDKYIGTSGEAFGFPVRCIKK